MNLEMAAERKNGRYNPTSPDKVVLMRRCDKCPKKKTALQRAAVKSSPEVVPPIVHEVLNSPGQPLDRKTREFMEPRFEHNFSQVIVHSDDKAALSARAVNALAYTVGNSIVFDRGQYSSETHSGRSLLAHELAHVIQQTSGKLDEMSLGKLKVGYPNDNFESDASRMANFIMNGGYDKSSQPPFALRQISSFLVQREAGANETQFDACIGKANDDLTRCTERGSTYCTRLRVLASISGGLVGAGLGGLLGTAIAPGAGTLGLGALGSTAGVAVANWALSDCNENANKVCRSNAAEAKKKCAEQIPEVPKQPPAINVEDLPIAPTNVEDLPIAK